MASIDLNIVDRSTQGQDWSAAKGAINTGDLSNVTEQVADYSGAMNSLPTPFARFFVVDEAFRRVLEERQNSEKKAGIANEWLVSDCLDMFEILFNRKRIEDSGFRISIREWSVTDDLARLQNSLPVLGKSLSTYIEADLPNTSALYFIVLQKDGRDYLLGSSSPYTGFVTTPDLDKERDDNAYKIVGTGYASSGLKDNGGKDYFGRKEPKLFGDRETAFKNYIYNLFSASGIDANYKNLNNYIRSFNNDEDIKADALPALQPVKTDTNQNLTINGITLSVNNSANAGNIFTGTIIRLPYKISKDNFKNGEINAGSYTDYGYLLPFTEYALQKLSLTGPDTVIKITDSPYSVTISVECPELQQKENKTYRKTPTNATEGKIIEYGGIDNVNFDMGIFPIVRSSNSAGKGQYFKIMLAADDRNANRQFSVNEISCDFYSGKTKLSADPNNSYGVRQKIVRSENDATSTGFYEVFNTNFDLINVKIGHEGKHSGVLIPKWRESASHTKGYKYTIDLGTSNTFMSATEINGDLEPRQLTTSLLMAFLHEKDSSRAKPEIHCWEDKAEKNIRDAFRSEFIPALIDGNNYKFPLRTALSLKKDVSQVTDLFGHGNIAFSYEKNRITGANRIDTDIKWGSDGDLTKIFIRELLLIIQCDLLNNGGNAVGSEIVYFKPLSLNNADYDQIWEDEVKKMFGDGMKVMCVSESEAPYYYFQRKNVLKSVNSAVIVDIGGGSTDFVYFKDNHPVFANSVHFGCDVLWGNGHDQFSNSRKNGIFQKYKSIKFSDDDKELSAIYSDMVKDGSSYSTKDIINFWISNSVAIRDFEKELAKDFRHVFAYHYTSIIWYLANMIHDKGYDCPRGVVFSGNGSHYIDSLLTRKTEVLKKLTKVILDEVFGEGNYDDVQLILPEERKESTCYGGLYRDDTAEEPDTVYYHGVRSEFDTVGNIKSAFETELKSGLMRTYSSFSETYLKVLSTLIVEEEQPIQMEAIRKCASSNMEDYLEKGYKNEVLPIDGTLKYKDSLFFIPVIDKILDLTNLTVA